MKSTISKILIAHPERILRDGLCAIAKGMFPRGQITTAATCKAAHAALSSACDLILTEAIFPDGDILDLAPRWSRSTLRPPPILVVTHHKEPRLLECIQDAGVSGVFDSENEGIEKLKEALAAIVSGREYASPSIVERMPRFTFAGGDSTLTPLERLVFAAIGDGSSDEMVATRLKRSPQTIKTVRGWLHEKLGVTNRGELTKTAVRLGFICFTAQGIVRPGFKRLLAVCRQRVRRV